MASSLFGCVELNQDYFIRRNSRRDGRQQRKVYDVKVSSTEVNWLQYQLNVEVLHEFTSLALELVVVLALELFDFGSEG